RRHDRRPGRGLAPVGGSDRAGQATRSAASRAARPEGQETMNAKAVARHYGSLTPEERFRLILAASGRGDGAERDRLAGAGEHITLSTQDFWPYAQAFDELTQMVYIELQDAAAGYFDALARADDDRAIFGDGDEEADQAEEVPDPGGDTAPAGG